MSANSSSRRPARRQRDSGNVRKVTFNVDLNDPPVAAPATAASASASAAVSRASRETAAAAALVNLQQRSQRAAAAAAAPVSGRVNSPIDVEAIAEEDDVQMLSSSRGFPQARNQSRRNRPVMVVLDEDSETHGRARSGIPVEDLTLTNKHQRIPPNRIIINAELYSEDYYNAKRMKSVREPEKSAAKEKIVVPEKVVLQEPVFSCPVCMGNLEVPCSTICGHVFCERCIKASIQAQKKCPTCRRNLSTKSFHRVYLPTTN